MRRKGRECALQILYQMDLGRLLQGQDAPSDRQVRTAIQGYWGSFDAVGADDQAFAERLVYGVTRELRAIDAAVQAVSQNWKLHRMDKVDRNLLRLSAYEILRCLDTPRSVAINEAIEIAKRFSGNESAAFINGVLDQLRRAEAQPVSGTARAAD